MTIDDVMNAAKEAEDLRVSEVALFSKGGAVPTPVAHNALIANLRSAIEAYGAEQRERCAVACEQYGGAWDATTQNFAQVIRALGDA